MRVIAGIYGSRRLDTLRGQALRPSSDRLRETLFNILASAGPAVSAMKDAVFIDLFAGSGAVGIEALSRGARHAIFVENHPSGVALLRRNLKSLGIAVENGTGKFPGGAEILLLDAVAALELLERRGTRADFVFSDPPYADSKAYDAVLEALGDSGVLLPEGKAIFEHGQRRQLPAVAGRLERTRVTEQGDSALSFFRVVRAA